MKYCLILFYLIPFSIAQLETAVHIPEIARVAIGIIKDLTHAWEIFGPEDAPQIPALEKALLKEVAKVGTKLEILDKDLREVNRATISALNGLSNRLPQEIKVQLDLHRLLADILDIDRKDKLFKAYTGVKKDRLEKYTLEEFARQAVSHEYGSVWNTLDRLQDYIVGREGIPFRQPDIFKTISKEWKSDFCDIRQSPQQMIYNLYTWLQSIQLKAYAIIQSSWLILRAYNKGNFSEESDILSQRFKANLLLQSELVLESLKSSDRDVRTCDAKVHVENDSYIKLTKFLQGFIENEVNLNGEFTCRENCPFYKLTKQQGCYKETYCSKQPSCKGNVVECGFVDSDMWVCPSSESGTDRRYEWIEYESGRTLGQKSNCKRAVTKVDSWWRWLFWHCSYCFCTCDDVNSLSTERYFSLKPTLSNTEENKVVTGLRFIKKNKMIAIQIQEGQLLPKSTVNDTTVSWKSVNNVPFLNNSVEAVDYHRMTWNQKGLDLDDLMASSNDEVVTGVRFRRLGSHLNLEVRLSKVNWETGELLEKGMKSHWLGNDNTDVSTSNPRREWRLKSTDIPTRWQLDSTIYSLNDSYLEFSVSSMDTDASQNTVPYFDSQEIYTNPPAPLSGVGIYHRASALNSGWIGLKLFTNDYSRYLNQVSENLIMQEIK